MASSKGITLVTLFLVLLPMVAMGDDLFPAIYEKVCEQVNCGKGTCVANITYGFNYICECDPGWKRTQYDDVDEAAPFLPCVIPNCTLDYSCQLAPPPVSAKEVSLNISFFDPCYWAYCGEGSCMKNKTYNYECSCRPGFYNVLNNTYFPCYSDCTIGSDCASVGIKVANQETTPGTGSGGSRATSILPEKFHWMMILFVSMALFMKK